MEKNPACPWCGSDRTAAEFVNIGVGMQQVSPYECADCQAQQFSNHDEEYLKNATPEERERNWWRGWGERDSLDPPPPAEPERVKCRDCLHTIAKVQDQDTRFRKAKADFEVAAKGMLDRNAQQDRVIKQLRLDIAEADVRARTRYEGTHQDLQLQVATLSIELNNTKGELERVRAELAQLKADRAAPIPDGTSRFGLLEID